MTNLTASLEYRRAVTQQASVVGLVIALHDTLVGDLRRAADAMDRNDIQQRSDELVHGYRVLQQLDLMLDMNNGGKTALDVRRFYTHVREQMLAAQVKLAPEILRMLVGTILEVREAWQQLDSTATAGRQGSASTVAKSIGNPGLASTPTLAFSCSG